MGIEDDLQRKLATARQDALNLKPSVEKVVDRSGVEAAENAVEPLTVTEADTLVSLIEGYKNGKPFEDYSPAMIEVHSRLLERLKSLQESLQTVLNEKRKLWPKKDQRPARLEN